MTVYNVEEDVAGIINRPIAAYHFQALTLFPQLCMGIQLGTRFPTQSADALPATLYGHFIQAIHRNRSIKPHRVRMTCDSACSRYASMTSSPPPPDPSSRSRSLGVAPGGLRAVYQGLTLVHFSAQLEPFLTHNTPRQPLNSP